MRHSPARTVATADGVPKLIERGVRLRLDAAVAEVFGRFEARGLVALLLKGASLDAWLHPDDEPRVYGDGDLLVAPADMEAAEVQLSELGFNCTFDDRSLPRWWRDHAGAWFRADDGVTVDLHRSLPGARVDADTAWRVLSREPDAVVVAGRRVPALRLPARAVHVVLHAAQHGAGTPQPRVDLDRALAQADDELWLSAAAMAQELDALDAFAAGLGTTDAGRRRAAQLQLRPPSSVDTALRAVTPPPVALGFEQLAQAKGVPARVEIVWRKLVPPPAFMRHWDPRAGRSRIALGRAYLRRPFWILRHAPRGFKAWYRARRSVGAARRI